MPFNAFPFIRYWFFLCVGIVGYIYTEFFHSAFYYILGGFVLLFIFLIRFRKPLLRGTVLWLIFTIIGWTIAYLKTPANSSNHFQKYPNFSHYQAVIIANAEEKPKTYKVEAEIVGIKSGKQWLKTSGKILLYFDKAKSSKPLYGDVFLVKGQPREVESPKNPYEFDYKQFLYYKGIYAHHFLWGNEFEKLGNQPPSPILNLAYKANRYADSVFKAHIITKNEYAVADAMVVGLRDEIDSDLLNAYSASGAIHVLSVSGMHVGILFLVLGWLFSWLKKRGEYGKLLFSIILISLLWVYAIFTGLSATVLRATVMFSLIQLGKTFDRRQNIYNTLAVSAFLLLVWNPYWLIDVGFQLSYLAIIGIVFLHPYLINLLSPTNPILRETWAITVVCISAQLFTFPLSIYYFHQFPTYFLIANPFVALFSFAVLPAGLGLLLFAQIPYLSTIFALILKYSLVLLNKSILLVEKVPFSTMKGFSVNFIEILIIYGIIFLIIKFFLESEIKFLWFSVGLLGVLGLWNFYEDFRQHQQQQLTIHFIPKKSGISIIDGKTATFMADSSLLNSQKIYNFHLKNFYDTEGISRYHFVDSQQFVNEKGMTFLEFRGKKIFWLQQFFRGNMEGKADILLLSNNALKNLYPALSKFKVNQIIVDDSNKRYVVENLKNQADSLHLNLVSLYDSGAFVVK